MLQELKLPMQIEITDWIELGGTLYAVSKAPELNDYGQYIIHLTHDPRRDPEVQMVVFPDLKLETYKIVA